MTRAEYEQKYGTAPPLPKLDVTPSPVKMTRAEYVLKYGVLPGQAQTPENVAVNKALSKITPSKDFSLFGRPAETVKTAGEDVFSAIMGQGKYAGQGAVQRGFSAASSAALAIPATIADVIPGGKVALEAISHLFEGGINTAASVPSFLADLSQKIGIMSPEERERYDKNNADFANTPVGHAIDSGASVLNSAGNVAMTILLAHGTARAVQDFVDKKVPAIKAEQKRISQQAADRKQVQAVQEQANEIAAVETNYAKGRKLNRYSTNEGADSRTRLAETNVLEGAVDETGKILTRQKGGAVDQYKAMSVKPAEGVVRDLLVKEGRVVSLAEVEAALRARIKTSGLEGADLAQALNGVKRQVAGLRLRADANGNIGLEILQDAKVNEYGNINFQTPPETATYRKAVAGTYKTLIETKSSHPIKAINADLAKYYSDITRLESLDGLRVQGGKLGKYVAQISGNVVGAAVGGLFGGFGGATVGTVVGGELASLIKGKSMAGTFNKGVKGVAPKSPVIEEALAKVKEALLQLPEGSGIRVEVKSGPTIQLNKESQSTIDAREVSNHSIVKP